MSVALLLQPVLLWNWYFKAAVIGGKPAYVFYDENSRIVFYLSKNFGGVDDFSADKGAVAIAWWDLENGRRKCHVSFIGRDFREFRRLDLGECGESRMGLDLKGLDLVVIYSKPYLSGEGCIVKGWRDFKLFYLKHVGSCIGGDVFFSKDGKVEYLKVTKRGIDTSWDGSMRCEKVVYEGGWVECDGKRLSP